MNIVKKKVAIFSSGTGTNARNIIAVSNRLKGDMNNSFYEVKLILCNKPGAGVFKVAEEYNIPAILIDKENFFRGDSYLPLFQESEIDILVLAGFLWKIPSVLIHNFPKKIINIHPALLPKYGGKGMFGHHVHDAIIKAEEAESGITIHFVDEIYDHGQIILQATCTIVKAETSESLAEKIHELEYRHFPSAIELICNLE